MVIVNNMDSWECLFDLNLFWDPPWGGFVTLKIESNKAIFKVILNIL